MPDLRSDPLDAALARDGARPFLTWYDDASGERLELSVTTFAVWVAKTGWYLDDAYGPGAGDVVRLDLPRHWLRAVWAVAAWRAGCTVTLEPDDDATLLVRGPAEPAAPVPARDGEKVAVVQDVGRDGRDVEPAVPIEVRHRDPQRLVTRLHRRVDADETTHAGRGPSVDARLRVHRRVDAPDLHAGIRHRRINRRRPRVLRPL